ncbi:hypothetical protein SAMN05443572_105327 [Myxococcus fulvus]|uniref:Uncharacterized protein n=1 Tax=Myxococcus fulvus TaxID=33 RepID=A0A511T4I3_MYXFU|nr:hypothetical protein [Myxococcus fulvus]GEN09070.1 hypothetical protein MFU01_41070 [Myxococcus fulvus]SEU15047.1 hypothetical protein SAMN05443572_105327 [Myxococcus fulvus]
MAQLQADELLYIPNRKRLTHDRLDAGDGQKVLHLFYGEVELIFDEPDIAPLGEKLLQVEQFQASDAMAWSDGAPHSWEKIRDLLEMLMEQRVLRRVSEAPTGRTAVSYPERLGDVPAGREPLTFGGHDNRCPVLTEQAFGRAFELSNLEVVVPVYRVAHPALDADGRQVGENNVAPRTLFLDLPTVRKQCHYAGSRYQSELPMNVTAMKAMARQWPELLSLTEQFRRAFLARMPPRTPGVLTAGELHMQVVCTLASVGYVLVRGVDPARNGELDSGLSAMFRLIDGVRLVTNDLVREAPEQPVTAQTIMDYAERHAVFHGPHGVCAGPPALINEYMQVMTGATPAPIDVQPDIAARLGDLDAALDYGLLGQRVESVVRFLGASQGLLHERLRAAFAGHLPRTALQEFVEAPIDVARYPLLRDDFPLVETYQREIKLSRWLFARLGEAFPGALQGTSLDELAALDPTEQATSQRRLAEFFAHGLPGDKAVAEPLCGEVAGVAASAFALERRCLRVVEREQAMLNQRLRRANHPLTGADLAAFTRPRNGPPMAETLARGLGVSVTSHAASTVLSHGESSLTLKD